MTAPLFDEFERLSAAVLDETASRAEVRRFNAILRDVPELAAVYLEQAQMHAMLECRGADASGCGRCGRAFSRAAPAAGIPAEKSKSALSAPASLFGRRPASSTNGTMQSRTEERSELWHETVPISEGLSPLPQKHPALPGNAQGVHGKGLWWKAAAAAAVLLGGAAVWHGATRPSPSSVLRLPSSVSGIPSPLVDSPVTVVEWKGAWGLEMPQTLPGGIRLAKGQVRVRLPSGVELVLLGPLELEAETGGMEVRLAKGRLVAWVPRRASGFTVRAPGLTAWDIGTVFSVETEPGGSSLFVFKGSVQVLDGAGDGVDLCEAGEGVRAIGDRTPFKVTSEGAAAERLFKTARGYAALAEPRKAFDVARQIGELWMAKYVPEEASRVREKAAQQAALRSAPQKIPFTKTAWVRPAAPTQQEERSMNTTSAAALAAAAVMMGAGTSGAVSEPVSVDAFPDRNNRHWTTVYTNPVPLRWEWNADAATAHLEIVGMNGAVETNFASATSNWVWQAFASDVPAAEDVYALTLTFFHSGGAVVGAATSRLAVVTGAFGQTPVDPSPTETAAWGKVKENVVIPYDAGWAEATSVATNALLVIAKSGGAAQTNALADSSGYYGWRLKRGDWGYGTFNLALTFPGTEGGWDATLARVPEGMMIKLR